MGEGIKTPPDGGLGAEWSYIELLICGYIAVVNDCY